MMGYVAFDFKLLAVIEIEFLEILVGESSTLSKITCKTVFQEITFPNTFFRKQAEGTE